MTLPEFDERNRAKIAEMGSDRVLRDISQQFLRRSVELEYSYHFRWLGRPIIQYPQDVIALQELIWRIKPDAIVETGIAHGGSLIFFGSMLHLLGGAGIVVGVDIDIRAHNRVEIEAHPMAKYIHMIQGSSIDPTIVNQVSEQIASRERVLVVLDSMHSHDHVLEELRLYSPFVTKGSYLVVLDTCIEQLPKELYPDRPWGPGNNPWTATREFLRTNDRFVVDRTISDKLAITVAPDGYLECIEGAR